MLQFSQMKMKNCRPQAAHNTFTDLTHVRQKKNNLVVTILDKTVEENGCYCAYF